MKKIKKPIKLNYYQTEAKIDTTALLNLLKEEILFDDEEIVKVFEVYHVIYIAISRNDLMEEIDNLYPNIFQKCETPILQGNIIFSNQ